ncbi:phosphoribosylamine--glycine ligase, partial [Methanosalsum natronophilum]
MNVLIVGSGGREHVIAETVAKSKKEPIIFAVMSKKNPGIAKLCKDYLLSNEVDTQKIVNYALINKIDIAFIGPEAPLAAGIVDELEDKGIKSIGPKKEVARIEFDKAWTRKFMQKYNIEGCPKFGVFNNETEAISFIDTLESVAIKPAGLTGGKGVKVTGDQLQTLDDTKAYVRHVLEKDTVVIEEKLIGEEFTLQAFSDGHTLAFAPTVQDHKRAFEGDKGPNTGGMGSYNSSSILLPFLTDDDLYKAKNIMLDTIKYLKEETSELYKGVIYGQFILTKYGPKVIEFNARFGDPEAMNILPLLKTDFLDVAT